VAVVSHGAGQRCGRPECPRDHSVELVPLQAVEEPVSEPVSAPAEPVSEPDSAPASVPESRPLTGPVRLMPGPAPVKEAAPVPERKPASVDPMYRDSAFMLGRIVWERGPIAVRDHFHGIHPSSVDKWISAATAAGWIVVDKEGRMKRGSVNPAPPPGPALSPLEARLRWGPD
jgi:hypothetical protein